MAVRLFEMVEDLSDDWRLGDEGHDAEGSRALGANERVDFKHPSDEMGPSASLMRHVLEHLIVKQSRKRRGSLRVARRADPSLTAGERQKSLERTYSPSRSMGS